MLSNGVIKLLCLSSLTIRGTWILGGIILDSHDVCNSFVLGLSPRYACLWLLLTSFFLFRNLNTVYPMSSKELRRVDD